MPKILVSILKPVFVWKLKFIKERYKYNKYM